ncbi:MAG: Peptidase family S33-like protein [Bacteroidetes bacterium]|jgi:pimeloyl-ACP methyl ester carboxylesterase|nr:Peptidase family S33-like protein [Bacteroidota bacterium]
MQLAFRKFGEGQPLLILHGLFGQSDNWNTLAKRFGEQGFSTYAIDLRNHGLSPHSDVWNYDAMAEDLMELIKAEKLEKPLVLGHSMGGKAAMFFALNYPDVADRLIVADISPNTYAGHHNEVIKALHSVDFNTVKSRKEAEAILSQYISDFGTKQFLLKNIYWKDGGTEQMDWRFNLKVITEKYDEILVEAPNKSSEIKTLFVRGEKSNYVENTDLPAISARFPNHELVTIPHAGHWVHAEQPEAFFNAVMEFLKK